MLRRFYDLSLEKAKSPHAQWILFGIAFAESSCLIFPPDILLLVMVLSARDRWIRYALVCVTGSVLGGIAGYFIGFGVWEMVHPFFFAHIFSEEVFHKVQELYKQYDFWIVFTAAFTPIPYKVFTISAGVAQLDITRFVIASIIGRAGRFFLVSFLLYRFGPPIRQFIEKYFNYVTIGFTALLIGGFFVIKYLAH